jgi:hypothetical protein
MRGPLPAMALALALWGCAAMLPQQKALTHETWSTFDDARGAIERIVPYETRRSALEEANISPYKNPAVALLSYSDVLQRFITGSTVRSEDLDRGLRECLAAGKSCTGYQIDVRRVDRNRVGNFWLDLFNFKREVDVRGWTFRGLILFVDDTVVYTLYSGQPVIREEEITRNPLGPLQGWGESAGSAVLGR